MKKLGLLLGSIWVFIGLVMNVQVHAVEEGQSSSAHNESTYFTYTKRVASAIGWVRGYSDEWPDICECCGLADCLDRGVQRCRTANNNFSRRARIDPDFIPRIVSCICCPCNPSESWLPCAVICPLGTIITVAVGCVTLAPIAVTALVETPFMLAKCCFLGCCGDEPPSAEERTSLMSDTSSGIEDSLIMYRVDSVRSNLKDKEAPLNAYYRCLNPEEIFDEECALCRDSFSERVETGIPIVRINCGDNTRLEQSGHDFCEPCIKRWNYREKGCPVCRGKVHPHSLSLTSSGD